MPAQRVSNTHTPTTPALRDFQRLARTHSLVPVTRTVAADLETPVSAFLRVAALEPEAFLLESVEGGEHVGRYTFIGIRPYKRMTYRDGQITVSETGTRKPRTYPGDIFTELKQSLSGETPAKLPGLPPFTAGAVGFFAYDVVRSIEKLPTRAADELHVPDAHLMFFDEVLAFDHVKKAIHLIVTTGTRKRLHSLGAPSSRTASSSAKVGSTISPTAAYADANRRLDRLEKLLSAAIPLPKRKRTTKQLGPLKLQARTPTRVFLNSVAKIKDYILAGDIFQCVLSQRFDCTPNVDAFDIYRSLRIVNPSPYMYFLRFPKLGIPTNVSSRPERSAVERPASRTAANLRVSSATPYSPLPTPSPFCHIVGSSPEMLVRVHTTATGSTIEYRPIAGSRPRGADEPTDRAMEASLRADAKEIAEHVMLVDLGRNDLGRVSDFGTVKVKDLMFVERYSHIMHLVSALEGKLRPGLAPLDALRACFPAGTLSGAPKIRAMEIIEELEPARRGVYGGAIIYADFSGNLDSCIAIRTLFMDGPEGHIQAGAGIVADSVPQKEHEECQNKAKAVVRAIERARQM
ncbi:anthranilate synthase component I [Granulicella sp. 5B5]|uniref:anthranilate synthase component I family protein n=1 Tax=Granulicella sp. 5B5 TaxID=1617967 RepID=UPI0015F39AEF|nr:chorismate-binding protein [Granulicella sp. 5B5]QMV19226.1 anthranilate synthase component I [Granulicella sp. 5B5]